MLLLPAVGSICSGGARGPPSTKEQTSPHTPRPRASLHPALAGAARHGSGDHGGFCYLNPLKVFIINIVRGFTIPKFHTLFQYFEIGRAKLARFGRARPIGRARLPLDAAERRQALAVCVSSSA
jgi:hypothetical protein